MSLFRHLQVYKLSYFCGESYCILYVGTAPVAGGSCSRASSAYEPATRGQNSLSKQSVVSSSQILINPEGLGMHEAKQYC